MSARASPRAVGIALALAGVVCFSTRPLLVKLAYEYATDPVTLLALRMVFSLPFFIAAAAWSARSGGGTALSRRDAAAVVGLGFLGYYFASFADFLGLQYISAGIGRLIMFLYPTIVVVLSALFGRKPVSAGDWLALGTTYLGVALVLSNAISGQNANLPLGAALVFASATGYAVYLLIGAGVVQRIGSVRFSAYATSVASVLCIAQFFALRPVAALDLPAEVYGLAVAMAIFSTVLPVFMTSEALRRIGAREVALLGTAGPVTTIALAYVGLDEAMTLSQLAGAVLVLGGVLWVTLRPAR